MSDPATLTRDLRDPGSRAPGFPVREWRVTPPARPAPPRLRVCLHTPSYAPSGMGGHMVDLAAGLLPTADVTVLAWASGAGRDLLRAAAAVGARAVALPHPRDPGFGDAVVAHLRRHPADVFHLHVGFGKEDFEGARAARRAGVRAVVQTQHLPWLLRARRPRERFARAIRPVDRLIAVSEAQRATYERIGVPPERLTTVPNGVRPRGPGPGRAAARAALGLGHDGLVVLTVGRLVTNKGQRYLVEAVPGLVERFPGVRVVVLGDGHLREHLRRRAADLGVGENVVLPGHRADARLLLDAADVFVLPSLREAMPLALLEAMDAGVPVVTTRVFGSAEIVEDGVSGLLVPPGDPAALGGAVTRLLADVGMRARYAEAGRRRYREHFTAARMVADTLAVYAEVLAGAAGPAPAPRPGGLARVPSPA